MTALRATDLRSVLLFKAFGCLFESFGCLFELPGLLFEVNADGLVEEAALEVLVLGLLGKVLEAEETGGIAFLNGDLEVTGGVE